MSLRLELLRWVNEKCPKMKASNIESLSDGRHYLFLLKKYFPEIQVPPFRKQWSVSQKLESLGQVQQYCQKLDGQITMDLYKMANKDSGLLINLLKWLKNIYDKTPQKTTPMKEEIIQQRNDVIVEEVPLGKQFEDKRTQTEEKILSVNVIKRIFSLNLPYPFFQIELIKHLDQNDPEVKKLACHYKQSVGTLSKCADSQEETRRTEFYSIHSSQFYERPEMNLLDIEFVENTTTSKLVKKNKNEQYMYLIPSFQFLFDIKSNIKIRYVEIHLVQPLMLLFSNNQILQIWDYDKKTCLRAINVPLIEPDKVQDVKQVKFHDNQIIYRLFNDQSFQLQNNVMILTSDKLYSYKYCSDYSDLITNGPIGVQNKCLEFIDSQYIAVGGEGVKIIDLKLNQIVKTMKGYHQKGINIMLSYKQNQFDRPRLVASSLDGTMACWNADTALETPAFKFLMLKKGKQLMTANKGQEILSIAYDPYDFQIVTVTESYVTLWSSLNGMEINRFKPPIPIKEIVHISHSSFPSQTYVGHTRSSEIYALYLIGKQQKKFDYAMLLDLKNVADVDKTVKINAITTNRQKSNLICVATTHGLYLLRLSEMLQRFQFHHTFVCPLTLNQSKTFVDDTGLVKKLTNISQEQLKQFEILNKQTDQSNLMYLTINAKNIICTLVEFTQELTNKKEEWTAMSRQNKIFTFQTSFTWEDSKILVSLSGRYLVVHHSNGNYVILTINNKNLNYDMMENEIRLTLHFLSELEQLSTGMANSIAWHQYREELAVCLPLNEKNQSVLIEEKVESQTSGFFNQKTYSRSIYNYDSNIVNFIIHLYGFDHTKKQAMFLKAKINNLPQPERVFGLLGYYFIVTNSEVQDQKAKHDVKSLKLKTGQFYQFSLNQFMPIGNQFIAPNNVISNMNETFILFIYETTFSLLQKQNNQYCQILQQTELITDAYFWEDLLFYVTPTQIKMVTSVGQTPITITLAQSDPPQNQLQSCEFLIANQLESQFPEIQIRPNGQLKILMLHDSKLVVINQAQEISFIHLKHALLEFCINLQIQDYQKCVDYASKLDLKMQKLIAQMLIAKNAVDQIQYLNMDLHERLTLELEHNLNETQLTLDLIDQVMLTVLENKEQYLKDLAVKLYQQKRQDELDLVIQYGLQNQLFSLYSIIPMLSPSQRDLYLEQQGIFEQYQYPSQMDSEKQELMLYNLYSIFQL